MLGSVPLMFTLFTDSLSAFLYTNWFSAWFP